jgi:hypothetical protein
MPIIDQSTSCVRATETLIAAKQDGRAAGLWDLDATGLVPRPIGQCTIGFWGAWGVCRRGVIHMCRATTMSEADVVVVVLKHAGHHAPSIWNVDPDSCSCRDDGSVIVTSSKCLLVNHGLLG